MAVKVDVVGRLGGNAEIKTAKDGRNFTTFHVAVDDYERGERKTVWFSVIDGTYNCTKRAEYLTKGALVRVSGREGVRIYNDRNGFPQIARDIQADSIEFIPLGNKQDNTATQQGQEQNVTCGTLNTPQQTQVVEQQKVQQTVEQPSQPRVTTPQPQPQYATVSAESDFIDDLPF